MWHSIMKNLPDDELFNLLKVRLQNFEEQPDDDVWETITRAISRPEPGWIKPAERSSLIIVWLLVFGGWYANSVSGWWASDTRAKSGYALQSHDEATNAPASESPDVNVGAAQSGKALQQTPEGNLQELSVSNLPGSVSPRRSQSAIQRDPNVSSTRQDGARIRDIDTRSSSTSPNDHFREATDLHATGGNITTPAHQSVRDEQIVSPVSPEEVSISAGIATSSNKAESNSTESNKVKANEAASSGRNDSQKDSLVFAEFTAAPTDSLQSVLITPKEITTRSLADSAGSNVSTVIPVIGRRKMAWQIYAVATPSLTFQHITPSGADEATFLKLNSPGVPAKERISMAFEAGVNFTVARRLHAFAGLTYYQQWIDLSLEESTDGDASFSSEGGLDFTFRPSAKTTTVNYNLQNVGATVGLMYDISMGKIKHQLGASLQYEHSMRNPATDSGNDAARDFLNYRILYRAEYSINGHVNVFVQPSFIRSLTSQDLLNGAIGVKQSRVGIGIGVLYRF